MAADSDRDWPRRRRARLDASAHAYFRMPTLPISSPAWHTLSAYHLTEAPRPFLDDEEKSRCDAGPAIFKNGNIGGQ